MAFCTNCGKELKESDKFCPFCGKAADARTSEDAEFIGNNPEPKTEQSSNWSGASQNTYSAPVGNDFGEKFNEYASSEDKTYEFDRMDIEDNKVFALLSYIGILVLVPLLAAPKSKFARFHANQGLVLLIGEVAFGVARAVLIGVLKLLIQITIVGGAVFTPIYWVVSIVTGLVSLIFPIFSIMGIIYAAQGKAKELPLISKIKILK
ncbi:MAG: zinc-ribbon domain-containing protein [Acutalibacteraceae bacterium]